MSAAAAELTAGQLMAAGAARLRAAGIPDAMRDARLLFAHAAGIAPDRVTLAAQDPVTPPLAARFEALIARRADFVPVSQLTGARAFFGRSFRVTRDVLDPRPETETLVGLALAAPFSRVIDLGTGSGCILLTLLAEREAASGLGTDISPAALAVAAENAARLGLEGRAAFRTADWWEGIEERADLVVSNPPYIAAAEMAGLSRDVREHEPHGALTDGADGLGAYRRIAAGALSHLRPGGRILVEIGPTQAADVIALFTAAGLAGARAHADLDGRDRVISAEVSF